VAARQPVTTDVTAPRAEHLAHGTPGSVTSPRRGARCSSPAPATAIPDTRSDAEYYAGSRPRQTRRRRPGRRAPRMDTESDGRRPLQDAGRLRAMYAPPKGSRPIARS
jgi:hypothetical protein